MSSVVLEEKEEIRDNKKVNNGKQKKTKKNGKRWLKRLGLFCLSMVAIGLVVLDVLLYGPNYKFRDWLVTNAMTTMNHRYLATWFYSDDEIAEVMSRNRVVEPDANTDTSLITVGELDNSKEVVYANEYDRQILEREEGQEFKVIEIHEDNYDAYLAAIYDPSRISVATTKYLHSSGQYLTDIAKENGASVAINGGGFSDAGGNGSGGTPLGITFSNGEFVYNDGAYNETFSFVGFNNENKLVLGKYTREEAEAL